jgi:hypothetical protein
MSSNQSGNELVVVLCSQTGQAVRTLVYAWVTHIIRPFAMWDQKVGEDMAAFKH